MVIFRSVMKEIIMILLAMIGAWDLLKSEIPVVLLVILSIASLASLLAENRESWFLASVLVILFVGIGIVLVRNGKMGEGDVWVLSCLAAAWPLEVFCQSVWIGSGLLCLTAMGIFLITGDESVRIPMVPFLFLGYWI